MRAAVPFGHGRWPSPWRWQVDLSPWRNHRPHRHSIPDRLETRGQFRQDQSEPQTPSHFPHQQGPLILETLQTGRKKSWLGM